MTKFIVTVLIILSLSSLGLFGYFYFRTNGKSTPKTVETSSVELKNTYTLQSLLNDLGWYKATDITLLDGEGIETNTIKNIEVIYTVEIQPYLQQSDGQGNIFASVGNSFEDGTLKFQIHVIEDRLTESKNKNWWISYQVIRALNKIIYYNDSEEELIERDRVLFSKYSKKSVDLWSIKF